MLTAISPFSRHRHERAVLRHADDARAICPSRIDLVIRDFVGRDETVATLHVRRRALVRDVRNRTALCIEECVEPLAMLVRPIQDGGPADEQGIGFVRRRLSHLQRQRDGDARADALRAFKRDAPFHQPAQMLADREPEPGAARLSQPVRVALDKRLKEHLTLRFRNANARIGHTQCERAVDPARTHDDLARIRELERVAKEVVEYLRDANRIEP